jgi:antitoxin VapB
VPISIRNPEVKRLAQQLAEREGRNLTEAIKAALEDALREAGRETEKRKARLISIAAACAALPDLDLRPESEILGYDADGAF